LREETDLLYAEDSLLQKEMMLQINTMNMKNNYIYDDSLPLKYHKSSNQLQKEKEKLLQEINQVPIYVFCGYVPIYLVI
jgi:hypothetical protein